MTFSQIVDPYLNHIGRHRDKESVSAEVIFPQLIMMKQYDIFNNNIAGAELMHKSLRMRNIWKESYGRFNDVFWEPYYIDKKRKTISEEGYAICDLYESFADYIEHHAFIAKIAVMNVLMDDGKSQILQDIVSDCYLCNALAKAAQEIHRMTYRTPKGQKMNNPDIESIIRCSRDLAKGMGSTKVPITEKREKDIDDAMHILIKKSVGWLFDVAPKFLKENYA